MKKRLLFLFLLYILVSHTARSANENRTPGVDAPDWENQHVLQINREPARAAFISFTQQPGDCSLTLNGAWKFHWSPTPEGRITDFFTPKFDDSSWKDFPVPANWEVNGYGTPIYVSSGYPFKIDPPRVTSTPNEKYTAFKERNPTGQYRRSFTLPANWKSTGQVFLRFDGVQSAFYVWINGKRVGYSQGSMEPSEFNVTSYLVEGQNRIAVEVYKYCDGSYLEDQDMWRFGGIQRSVTLYHTPQIRLVDVAVRTLLDKRYENATLEVDPKLAVFGNETGNGYKVRATIENMVNVTADVASILNLDHKAALMNEWNPQRGPRKTGRLKAEIVNPLKWTAETPHLYTLLVTLEDSTGKIVERVRQRIGFRSVEIAGGQMLVNGKPVRLRGVNRHEHDPRLGKVMTESLMLKDIVLMKRGNINAVRTCHYPNVTRWYELCDSLGMYVMDEADIEEHGLRGGLASDPDWAGAFLDRTIRMAERDKNHASVVMWSLGNEAGYGPNFAANSAWLKDFDPTRPIHYEGAQGLNGEPDPSTVDVISRFYPRVQQDYLNPGMTDGSDAERPENARWERLLSIAQRTNDTRPVMTSEYAHVMGNAGGNLQEYWDEMYSNKRMLGGFIWEWADEGIFKTLPNGKPQVSYGGDFGDYPNLKTFCIKGVVTSDREITPKYQEVRKVYQPVGIFKRNDKLLIINRNHHTSLSQYRCLWTMNVDGAPLSSRRGAGSEVKGELNLPEVLPGDSVLIDFPQSVPLSSRVGVGGEVIISFVLKQNTLWAKAGYEVAYEQFELQKGKLASAEMINKGKLKVEELGENFKASGNGFSASWNTKSGSLTSLLYNGKEVLYQNAKEFEYQPLVQAFRAPTDNDKSFGNWLAKDWKFQGLDSPKVSVDFVRHSFRKDGALLLEIQKTNQYKNGKVVTKLTYTVTADGRVDLECRFNPIGSLPELPRLGIALALQSDYSNLTWYGRGPQENYPDRKGAALVGLWSGKVSTQAEKYPRPQDTGNKEDVRFLRLSNAKGQGIKVEAVENTFSTSALNYSANDLANEAHECNLVPRKETILSLDCAVLGLGNSSCGPGVLKKYAIEKKEHVLHVRISKIQ
ncbi:MAG TPA: glycoside hydrolase family 2 TIM barrel-domain containing protein [Paludibacter sp.]